jgi:hypothetical protein
MVMLMLNVEGAVIIIRTKMAKTKDFHFATLCIFMYQYLNNCSKESNFSDIFHRLVF